MKAFNLEKALAGEKVVTRNRLEVKIAGYWEEIKYGLVGWIYTNQAWKSNTWSENGKYNTSCDFHDYDLFMAPEKGKLWYAVLKKNDGHMFTSDLCDSEEGLKRLYKSYEMIAIHSIEVEL